MPAGSPPAALGKPRGDFVPLLATFFFITVEKFKQI